MFLLDLILDLLWYRLIGRCTEYPWRTTGLVIIVLFAVVAAAWMIFGP
ncbi:MAG: hypothetical protein HRU70_14605 [Phycisphaeraceae bacterium]|nr:MAG: hypothetical protein HRU70_14605 [Phycisphaeraceae bacterium]